MSKLSVAHVALGMGMLCMIPWAACSPPAQQKAAEAPVAPAPTAYEPNFKYAANAVGKKLDVTVGVINPVFSDDAQLNHRAYADNGVVKEMVSALGATFNEILIAKGFNTKGPFVSLNDMTFPEKKGSDLLLYPLFDYQIELKPGNAKTVPIGPAPAPSSEGSSFFGGLIKSGEPEKKQPPAPVPTKTTCDVTLSVIGNVQFIAQEPLSGERMWIKRLDVSAASQTFSGQEGTICEGKNDAWPIEIKNAWAKAHELVYQSSMKAFDNYVNGEEFQMYKQQSQELRDKKKY